MIQRKQSLLLAIVTLLSILWFFLPLVAIKKSDQSFLLKGMGLTGFPDEHDLLHALPLLLLNALLLSLSTIAIFRFKDRKYQMKLCRVVMFLLIVLPVAVFLTVNRAESLLSASGDIVITYKPAIVIPLISFVLTWMAYRLIKKDEDLVRSIDRVR